MTRPREDDLALPDTDSLLAILSAHARREVPVWQHKFIAYDDLDECGACGLRRDEECHR